jgi:hypothetical protein
VADARPDLDAAFDSFGVEAVVTVPRGGFTPAVIVTQVIEVGAFNEPFPADPGNWSLTKNRARFGLRLLDLDVTEIPIGTEIAIATGHLTGTWKVDGTDVVDTERAIVVARKAA